MGIDWTIDNIEADLQEAAEHYLELHPHDPENYSTCRNQFLQWAEDAYFKAVRLAERA